MSANSCRPFAHLVIMSSAALESSGACAIPQTEAETEFHTESTEIFRERFDAIGKAARVGAEVSFWISTRQRIKEKGEESARIVSTDASSTMFLILAFLLVLVFICVCVNLSVHVCMYVCVCVCMYVCVCVCVCVYRQFSSKSFSKFIFRIHFPNSFPKFIFRIQFPVVYSSEMFLPK